MPSLTLNYLHFSLKALSSGIDMLVLGLQRMNFGETIQSIVAILWQYCTVLINGALQYFQNQEVALAGVAQWMECWPANQSVPGLIPGLGHMPGLRAGYPMRGHTRGNHTLMFLSLSSSLPSFL